MFRMATGSLNEQWGCSFLIVWDVTKGKHSSHRCLDTHQQQGAAALPSPRTFLQVNLPKTLWEKRRLKPKPLSITRINVCYLLTLWNVDGPGHGTFDIFLAAFCFMYQMICLHNAILFFKLTLPWYGMNTKCNQYVWVVTTHCKVVKSSHLRLQISFWCMFSNILLKAHCFWFRDRLIKSKCSSCKYVNQQMVKLQFVIKLFSIMFLYEGFF